MHRLTQAVSPGTYGTRTYAYDAIGNLTSKDGVTQTYGHATKPHAVTARSDGLTMTYDANGNMITKGTQTLAYDAENRLLSVTSGGTTQASFVYDGDGGRVQKVTASGTTTYIGKLYEQKPDGTFVKYVWVGSTRLASKASTGALLFYHPNHLGSTDLVTDAQGTQVAHYEYTPYGELFSTEGQVSVPHRFTGKELDPETGLYFYEARYYDPQLGRFITPDTIVPNWTNPQDFNRYTYANNNPLKYTDPTGHKSFWKKVKSFFKQAASIIIAVAVTVVTGGFGSPLALAIGGFAGGFGGTLINGGSIGQAFGMGIVGAFAGGVGGVAFQKLGDIARIAALTAIGATAGASGAAIMGGNPLLGAAAGGAAGFLGGAVGGRLADAWKPGLARIGAGIGLAAGAGAASGAIAGGSPGTGAALGAFGAVTVAIASGSLQQALDAGRAKAGAAADGPMATKVVVEKSSPTTTYAPRQMGAEGTEGQVGAALTVNPKFAAELGVRVVAADLIGATGTAIAYGGTLLMAAPEPLYSKLIGFGLELVGAGLEVVAADLATGGRVTGWFPYQEPVYVENR